MSGPGKFFFWTRFGHLVCTACTINEDLIGGTYSRVMQVRRRTRREWTSKGEPEPGTLETWIEFIVSYTERKKR